MKTHGLPPSRLMVGKNLHSEFEQLAVTGVTSTPFSGSPSSAAGSLPPLLTSAAAPAVLMPGETGGQALQQPGALLGDSHHQVPQPPPDPPDNLQLPTPNSCQSFGQLTGISSSSNPYFMLGSSPQSLPGSTNGPVGWSEARPVSENSRWDGMTLLPSGLPGSTSGYPTFLALSPSPQSSIGIVPPYQTPPQPPSPSGSPAYCFHSMQYGAVFTINQV